MKTAIRNTVSIFLAVAAIASAVVFLSVGITGCAEKETSGQFTVRIMEEAVRNWDAAALYGMTSEQFKEAASADDVERMFKQFSVLGNLKGYNPPAGQVTHEKLPNGADAEVGSYQVKAEFDNDDVTVAVVAIHNEGGWALYGFNIKSNYVMSIMESQRQNIEQVHKELEETFPMDNASN